jgi:hypothetical protein
MGSLDSKNYIEAIVPYAHAPPPSYIAGALHQYRREYDKPLLQVRDIRSYPDIDINETGFQLISIPDITTDRDEKDGFDDQAWVERNFYPVVKEVMGKATGAARVHPFSHLVRRKDVSAMKKWVDDKGLDDQFVPQGVGAVPSPQAHIDHSANGSWEVLRDNLPDVAGEMGGGKGRWGIVNLWRPLRRVRRDPLVVCDWRSVEKEDLVVQVSVHCPLSTLVYLRIDWPCCWREYADSV